jgi:hypothetical protein
MTSGATTADEQQQRGRDAHVLAVGDDLDPVDQDAVTGDVPDADVHDRRDRHDAEERERRDLLAPRTPDPERASHRCLVQREG